MSGEGENEGRGFKVVDRRRFTTDGEEREGPDVKQDEPAKKVEATPPPAAKKEPPPPEAKKADAPPASDAAGADAEEEGAVTFSMFVQSMAQQALMQLGAIPHPATGRPEVHLEGARDTIDMLEMLRRKTKGNLDAAEQQLLDGVIYELRMTWVEVNNQLAAMAKEQPGGGAPKP